MNVLYIVVPLALLTVIGAVVAFSWATKSGQFDDLDTPSVRVLHDDEGVRPAVRAEGRE
ncbi:MAG: cbb3-type cytochrome oxidase assembly protein CcoS [Gemmatimonadaceae bacterium]|jgi:cbb3-type cytochrome oxidase maturation protein|nr:cbb3-type cytochrome oxidase assembly protein CcoS [Gemmatimonadaceae bacterium]